MAWSLMHPLPMTLITLFVALALLLGIRYVTGRFQKHPWVSAIGDISVAVVVAVVVAPWINDYWATKRDIEQRRWNARAAHLERLRPVLLADAATLADFAKRLSDSGHLIAFHSKSRDKEMDDIWNQNVLIRDLGAHFIDFFKIREQLRAKIILQESELFKLTNSVGSQLTLKVEHNGWRQQVAYSLVRRCTDRGAGIVLKIEPSGGYSYQDGMGGGSSISGGGVPPVLMELERAYREYQPDSNFTADCEQLAERANQLSKEFLTLSRQATALAETTVLTGECEYIRFE